MGVGVGVDRATMTVATVAVVSRVAAGVARVERVEAGEVVTFPLLSIIARDPLFLHHRWEQNGAGRPRRLHTREKFQGLSRTNNNTRVKEELEHNYKLL